MWNLSDKSRRHHSVAFSIATLIGKFCSLEKRKDKKDRKVSLILTRSSNKFPRTELSDSRWSTRSFFFLIKNIFPFFNWRLSWTSNLGRKKSLSERPAQQTIGSINQSSHSPRAEIVKMSLQSLFHFLFHF